MNPRNSHRLMLLISAIYLMLAVLYALSTPPFEASDELWHYPMVETIASNGFQLPVQDAAISTPWRQEGSQPPLYYMLAAALTSWIDTSDLEHIRRINPHADIGVVRDDGNANMIVHRAVDEAFPWDGAILALYVSRGLSILLGLGTIWVTYGLGRTLFPGRPEVALGAAAINAVLPMFLFISSSVNNDNLSNLLGNLLTLLVVRLLLMEAPPRLRDTVILGLVAGAGMLSKFNIGLMLPIIALTYLYATWKHRSLRPLLEGGLIAGGLTIFIAGWWYLRNVQLYGDPTGLNVFLDIVGRRAIAANAAQLWAERHSFTQFFWGGFGGVNIPLPAVIYTMLNIAGGFGLIGASVFGGLRLFRAHPRADRVLVLSVPVLWIAVTFVSYLRWTSETPASQGRLMFGALSSILILMVIGWTWWIPKRLRPTVTVLLCTGCLLVALYAPFAVIRPAYARPERIANFESAAVFGDTAVRGVGLSDSVDFSSRAVQPGDTVIVTTRWQIERSLNRDWSIFAHLITEDGVIISQRDVYPGGGTLATTDLVTGFAWENPLALTVPETAPAPQTLTVAIGWYDHQTGERLRLANGEDTFDLGTIELQPRRSPHGDIPNAVSVNFGGEMELIGYEISDLSVAAGEPIEMTLYWRGLTVMENDYVVFVHMIDGPTTTIYGASDAQPAGWTMPTSTWTPGEVVEDAHQFEISPDTPPGTYEVEIGVYLQQGDQFPRLRIVTSDGGMANDYIYLSRMLVLPEQSQ